MLSTIVISPRERFSSITETLRSLFKTIPPEQPVIVVEGATPKDIRAEMAEIARERPFEHIALPYPLLPNTARNIGTKAATTEFVTFCDNDITFEQGRLDALEESATSQQADLIAPLIFIGPSTPRIIHHAGGTIFSEMVNDAFIISERHRLSNAKWTDVKDTLEDQVPVETDGFEFHCVMIRRSLLARMGGLDESHANMSTSPCTRRNWARKWCLHTTPMSPTARLIRSSASMI